jgi:hypothetical protein
MAPTWEPRATGPDARVVVERRADDLYRRWRVWLADCRQVPGAPCGACLIFDAGEVMRRVWDPPAHWAALSDDALLALLDPPGGGVARPAAPPRGGASRADGAGPTAGVRHDTRL